MTKSAFFFDQQSFYSFVSVLLRTIITRKALNQVNMTAFAWAAIRRHGHSQSLLTVCHSVHLSVKEGSKREQLPVRD